MSNPSQASNDAISISMGSTVVVTAEPASVADKKVTASEDSADMDVLVSEIRGENKDQDLAPLALVGKDAIVFLAESDWTERPVMAVA